ncbi:MAG: deoxyribose-phosphate aldolase [Balneola sp.]|nr:deoxyribose-phosphate aldolase [Balneola sp.]|tara:strand:- start:3370 stop:4254 length:885 start_codon:yes stop_codon:yes gene_type:complete
MIDRIPIDAVGIQERVSRICTRSIKKESKLQALDLALRMIDLTTLEGSDSDGKVRQLCNKALRPYTKLPNIPSVAAVCVYPNRVALAKKILEDSSISVASVATAFPSGMSSLQIKLDDVHYAVSEGADEIDMVISRGAFLSGEYARVYDEIAHIKEACGSAHLKVILETGELGSLENIRMASDLAMKAGADFIKTSTGKISPAAIMPVVLVMLQAIRDNYNSTGVKVGMKPAGGIRSSKQAIQYLVMVKETLGIEWLHPSLFRFGASSLANDVLMQWVKEKTGRYQSLNYFSND